MRWRPRLDAVLHSGGGGVHPALADGLAVPGFEDAPQPGFVTLLAAGDPKQLKTYWLIVNPALAAQYDRPKTIPLGLPQTPADVMALAWAGEMLHIEFYAAGIALPHHDRADFQKRWLRVADALGMARAEHGTEELGGGTR